eukprot:3299790-Rhodomonas_salina.2
MRPTTERHAARVAHITLPHVRRRDDLGPARGARCPFGAPQVTQLGQISCRGIDGVDDVPSSPMRIVFSGRCRHSLRGTRLSCTDAVPTRLLAML